MKSECTIADHKRFPALYRTIKGFLPGIPMVVLFSSEFAGMVVLESQPSHPIGFYSDKWDSCFDNKQWEKLPPNSYVTLFQEDDILPRQV